MSAIGASINWHHFHWKQQTKRIQILLVHLFWQTLRVAVWFQFWTKQIHSRTDRRLASDLARNLSAAAAAAATLAPGSNRGCSEESTGAQEEAAEQHVQLSCSDEHRLRPKVCLVPTAVAFQLGQRRCLHDEVGARGCSGWGLLVLQ